MRKLLFIIFSYLLFSASISAQGIDTLNLPPLLTSLSGKKITTVRQWEKIRRPEILELLQKYEYGRQPQKNYSLATRISESSDNALGGKAKRKQVTLTIYNKNRTDSLVASLLIYLPKSTGRVPVFLGLNFRGNQTVNSDPAIFISPNWVPQQGLRGVVNNRAGEESRGAVSSRWPVDFLIESGYGVATAYCGDFDPDFHDGFKNGLHRLFYTSTDSVHKADDWGTISAWAFGLSRAMDYLVKDPDIDPKKVAVMGLSRLGKTSLVAGALDKRFAITISNESGCGGAALSKRIFGETVQMINKNFPHWFCENFKQFNNRESELPLDQHMLIAMMAPRPVYIASAEQDLHADPIGEYLSGYVACEVYELFKLPCNLPPDIPPVNTPLHDGYVGYHIRTGTHNIVLYDWEQYVKFADRFFKEK